MIDRRTFLAASGAALAAAGCSLRRPPDFDPAVAHNRFEAIRATLGPDARLGVAALDTGTGRWLTHDADSRYATASTFKLPLAGAILAEVDAGRIKLTDELTFSPEDPLDNSPVSAEHIARGRLDVERLCAAIVRVSDNSGANLLMRKIGGPEGLTRFFRSLGDGVTRIDRYELILNSNLPGDPRDTTSPLAMAGLARKLVVGDALRQDSKALLAHWMKTSVPGPDRLKAGIPAGWEFGHKTGTGARGAHNDVGVAWPPGRQPIVIASYQSGGDADGPVRAAAHASVARLVAERFA
jgi:beta-lactamase class A